MTRITDEEGNEWTVSDVHSQEFGEILDAETYWRSWAAVRVTAFMLLGMALGAFTASLIWWAAT